MRTCCGCLTRPAPRVFATPTLPRSSGRPKPGNDPPQRAHRTQRKTRKMDLKKTILLFVFSALFAFDAANPAIADDTAADREFTFAARLIERGEHKLAREAFEKFLADFSADPRIGDAHYYLAVLA